MTWVRLGSLFMFLAVGLGAFGAHALKDKLSGYYLDVYNKAVFYHFVHALALFVVAWLMTAAPSSRINAAGIFFSVGIILFSGSLYILSVSQMRILGAVTPLGGLCFLIGWALIFFSTGK